MQKKRILYFIQVICISFVFNANAQKDTLKVLFLGNSYTYFWNLPQTVQAMSSDDDTVLYARQSTAGGANWKQHWEGKKNLKSREIITQNNWDYVILQNHSRSTIKDLEQFMDYGERFIKLVRESGATPILYMTWAREYNPLMQNQISEGYRKLAEKHGVSVVPIGEMWQKVRTLRPMLSLFDPDGSHPSAIGTYLTACGFYSFLQKRPSKGLPPSIRTMGADGEMLYLSMMSGQNAEFIQAAVDETLGSIIHD